MCKKNLIFLSFLILILISLWSPVKAGNPLLWSQVYNSPQPTPTPYLTDEAYGVAVDGTGVYIVGAVEDLTWRIEKRNLSNGSPIWLQNPAYDGWANDVAVYNAEVYSVGWDDAFSHPDTTWRMEKRNQNGALLWSQTSNPSSESDRAEAVAVNSTGVYIIGSGWRIEKRNLSNGSFVWSYNDPPGYYSSSYEIAIDNTGIYIVGEEPEPDGSGSRWRMEKRNQNGALLWSQVSDPGPDEYDIAYSVAVYGTTVYIGGIEFNNRSRIEKRDSNNGSLIWASHGVDQTVYAGGFAGIAVDNTGIYAIGSPYEYGRQVWRIEKRDLDGNLLFCEYSVSTPYVGDAYANDIAVDSGGIYIVGHDNSTISEWDDRWRVEKRRKTAVTSTINVRSYLVSGAEISGVEMSYNQIVNLCANYSTSGGTLSTPANINIPGYGELISTGWRMNVHAGSVTGYEFSHWEGCDQSYGSGLCRLITDGDRTIRAYYDEEEFCDLYRSGDYTLDEICELYPHPTHTIHYLQNGNLDIVTNGLLRFHEGAELYLDSSKEIHMAGGEIIIGGQGYIIMYYTPPPWG